MRPTITAALLGVICLVGVIHSQEIEPTKRTEITVNETVLVPGKELPPGKYVLKVMNATANRHIVQIYNEDQTQLQTTILAIPNERVQRTANTVLTYWETPAGVPPALRAWFYPGDTYGQEFAYPKEMADRIAQANNNAQVPSYEGNPSADQLSSVTIIRSRTTTTTPGDATASTQSKDGTSSSNTAASSTSANNANSERSSQSATDRTAAAPRTSTDRSTRDSAVAESPQNTATTQTDVATAQSDTTTTSASSQSAERAAEKIESTTPRVPPPANVPSPVAAEQAGRSDIKATDVKQNDETTPAAATTASRSAAASSSSTARSDSADRSARVGTADRSANDDTLLAQNTPRPGAQPNPAGQSNTPAQPSTNAQSNANAQSKAGGELPRTASNGPLVLLIALMSIAAATALRALRA